MITKKELTMAKYPIMRLPGSLEGLNNLCKWIGENYKETAKCKVLEIGTYEGDSTRIFCKYFKQV